MKGDNIQVKEAEEEDDEQAAMPVRDRRIAVVHSQWGRIGPPPREGVPHTVAHNTRTTNARPNSILFGSRLSQHLRMRIYHRIVIGPW